MARVVLAMSGGVDSSVAAWLLREAGHEVIGLFMRHAQAEPPVCTTSGGRRHRQGCCSAADADDARRVADRLGIPFYALNLHEEFGRIVDYFVAEYVAGRTPNPCIVCNTWLKFGKLFEYADTVGADRVATGHYARLAPGPNGEPGLYQGRDPAKDQSYVLWGIRRELLPRLLFPLGDYRKQEIRAMAARLGLRVADKPDSQEICFVPEQDHARFVRQRRPGLDTSGEIVTTDGAVVGRHDGFERFTIGQRKGLRVAFGDPRYVVKIDPASRRVVVGTRDDLARWELVAKDANWLSSGDVGQIGNPSHLGPPVTALTCQVKIRYRSTAGAATVEPLAGDRFHVRFEEPCYAVAPGQAAVCYDGDRLLGGGWIE
jgi:tRNA-uridine 2-sulfurtransferase